MGNPRPNPTPAAKRLRLVEPEPGLAQTTALLCEVVADLYARVIVLEQELDERRRAA